MLHKLWYNYTYIYHQAPSNTATIITRIILFVAVVILMTTTDQPTQSLSSIISTSPNLPQTQSFTMVDYTPVIDWYFHYAAHLHSKTYHNALNDLYSEPSDHAVVDNLFTTAAKTTIVPNVIATVRAGIVDTILFTSTADRILIAPVINQMLLFAVCRAPGKRFPLRSPTTFTAALDATLATGSTNMIVQLLTTPIYGDSNNFDAMNFTGILLTSPIRHINVGAGAGAVGAATCTATTALTLAQITTTAAVTATAANQALVVQQTVAAAALVATLPTEFNSNTLPAEAKARYEHHLNPNYLMTKTNMQPLPIPTGGVCPVMFYLDPPMGTGVTHQPDSNRIITQNGQLFPLADQGNSGLKVFLASVPSYNCISTEAIRSWYMLFNGSYNWILPSSLLLFPKACQL